MIRFVLSIFLALSFFNSANAQQSLKKPFSRSTQAYDIKHLYQEMNLEHIINYDVFEQAIIGYNRLDIPNKDILTVIDFSKPSTEDRLFVLDLKNKKLIFSSVVSHGKNSGDNYATSFSNINGSNKSSLGFYLTEDTYKGRNGYSLRLNGLEKGINDNARARAIVIHGAAYANPKSIASGGRLGRSLGCPALPIEMNRPIIDTIKNGTLLYIYGNDKNYLAKSTILSGETDNYPVTAS